MARITKTVPERRKEIDAALNSIEKTASQKLAILLNKKLKSDGLDKLVPGITSDVAIIAYCSKKITSAAMPMLLSLIKQGNSDGSWNCKFPEETALFISNGFRGFHDNIGASENNTKTKKALMDIILKILGT